MAYPPTYERSYSFTGFQESNPTQPLPAGNIDAQLDAIAASIDSTRAFLMGALTAEGGVPGALPPAVTVTGYSQGLLGQANEAGWRTALGFGAYFQSLRSTADAAAFRTAIQAAASADIGAVQSDPGFGNPILNGDFRINQRAVPNVTGVFGWVVDRVVVSAQGGSRTVQRVALSDSDRTTIGRQGAAFALQYQATGGAASTDYELLGFPTEDVRRLAGRRVAVSFWARRTAGAGDLAIELEQNFGTGGSPSSAVYGIGGARLSLLPTLSRYVVYIDVPALTGKVIGTNGDDRLVLNIFASAGATFNSRLGGTGIGAQTATFQIADVKMEPVPAGASPTIPPFEPRSLASEVAACRRYARVFGTGVLGIVENSGGMKIAVDFGDNSMRAAPTLSLLTQSVACIAPGLNNFSTTTATVSFVTATGNGIVATLNGWTFNVTPPFAAILQTDAILASADL